MRQKTNGFAAAILLTVNQKKTIPRSLLETNELQNISCKLLIVIIIIIILRWPN